MAAFVETLEVAAPSRILPVRAAGVVRLTLAFLLCTAALLKGHQLATAAIPETSLLTARWFLVLVAAVEFLLGVWLLSGVFVRLAHRAALVWFTLLLGVALSQVAAGTSSCSCFGVVTVLPCVMVLVDLAAVTALWCTNATPPLPPLN